jgi:hypothetical protein
MTIVIAFATKYCIFGNITIPAAPTESAATKEEETLAKMIFAEVNLDEGEV